MCIRIYFLCFLHLSISFLTCPWCHRSKFRSKDNWFVVLGFRYHVTTSSCYPYPVGLRPASSSSRLTSAFAAAWCPTGNIQTFRRSCKQRLRSVMRVVYDRLTVCGEYLRVPQVVWTQLILKRTMHAACGFFVLIWHLTVILYYIVFVHLARVFCIA